MDPIEAAILRAIQTIRTAYDEGLEAGRLEADKSVTDTLNLPDPRAIPRVRPYAEDAAEYAHWISGFEAATQPSAKTVIAEKTEDLSAVRSPRLKASAR